MNSSRTTQVLIAGAGPSGLTLALALLKNGISVRIIEKEASVQVASRPLGIQPRSLENFLDLGVLSKMEIEHKYLTDFTMHLYDDDKGVKPVKSWKFYEREDPTPDTPLANSVLMPKNRIEAVLRAPIEEYSCHVEFGTTLVSFEQHPDHVVARLIKTIDGKETKETAEFAWLVGADGGKGMVRKQLGLPFAGVTRNEGRFLLGEIHLKGLAVDGVHCWGNSSSRSLMLLSSTADMFQYIGNGPDIDFNKVLSSHDTVRQFIREATGEKELELGKVEWATAYTVNVRMATTFGSGRVFLVGDSAHVHSFTGGQGLNSGVQDAINLAWKIALVSKGHASPSLLSTYSEERVPVISEMLKRTTHMLDNTLTKPTDVAWRRPKMLHLLGMHYRWSSIVVDEQKTVLTDEQKRDDVYGVDGDGHLRAGDRALDSIGLIDVASGTTRKLFELFGASHHTVLVFASSMDAAVAVVLEIAKYPADLVHCVVILPRGSVFASTPSGRRIQHVLEDREGSARAIYASAIAGTGAGEGVPSIVIVRPDRVIGGIVGTVQGLARYMRGVFSV